MFTFSIRDNIVCSEDGPVAVGDIVAILNGSQLLQARIASLARDLLQLAMISVIKSTKPSSVQEWLEYAGKAGIHPAIINYINIYKDRLGLDNKKGVTTPSPESWENLSKVIRVLGEDIMRDHKALNLLACKSVGNAGAHFANFINKINAL